MAVFCIRVADCVFSVESLFDSTRDYCRNYLTEQKPQCHITVTAEDLAAQQAILREEARQEGLKPRIFTDPFLERTVIQQKAAAYLLIRDTLLLHGSAVAVDGRGYLFTAPCGTGKSTHTRLWRQVFGGRAVMVNDDKPFVQVKGEEILLHGSPWSGKHGLDTNLSVPLQGICFLRRGGENRIIPITGEEALPELLHSACPPEDAALADRCRELVQILTLRTGLWRMECTKDPRAAIISHTAMSNQ